MPFTYSEFLSDYGLIPMDVTGNKDSYNEVLPNATNGVINVGLNLRNQLLNVLYQIIFIGEFRNEKKIGFNSPGWSLYDF